MMAKMIAFCTLLLPVYTVIAYLFRFDTTMGLLAALGSSVVVTALGNWLSKLIFARSLVARFASRLDDEPEVIHGDIRKAILAKKAAAVPCELVDVYSTFLSICDRQTSKEVRNTRWLEFYDSVTELSELRQQLDDKRLGAEYQELGRQRFKERAALLRERLTFERDGQVEIDRMQLERAEHDAQYEAEVDVAGFNAEFRARWLQDLLPAEELEQQ